MARWLLLVILALGRVSPAGAAPCVAYSAERTVALVELYVAQRCAGCTAAEKWLASLSRHWPAHELLALTLHVDYADYLQQTDASAERRLVTRERKLLLRQRTALVYTPQLLLQGRQFQGWYGPDFPAAVGRIHAQRARARLRLELGPGTASELALRVEAELLDPLPRKDAVLYLAAVQRRGNRPPRLLEWQGPFASGPDGRFAEERRLVLPPGTALADSGAAAFVQDRRTAEVLQAILLAACSG